MDYTRLNREEFEKILIEKFPTLYKDLYGDLTKTCMAFGISVHSGWFNIIYEMSEKINNVVKSMSENEQKLVYFAQIKEKFGILTCYMDGHTKEMGNIISEATKKSSTTCEECGKDGRLGGKFWLRTLCKKCRKTNDERIYGKE
jgi:hypothetical protein